MESHREMTAAHYECAAAVQLERMERMSTRLKTQWHQIRDTWHRHDLTTDDTAVLLEIVTRTGATVEEILCTSHQFTKKHRKTEPSTVEQVATDTNGSNDTKKTQRNDAKHMEGIDDKERLQHDAHSLRERGRTNEKGPERYPDKNVAAENGIRTKKMIESNLTRQSAPPKLGARPRVGVVDQRVALSENKWGIENITIMQPQPLNDNKHSNQRCEVSRSRTFEEHTCAGTSDRRDTKTERTIGQIEPADKGIIDACANPNMAE